jgi:hypothetical protein
MHIKHILILVFTFSIITCNDEKVIKYEYSDSEIELNWFYYSYRTNTIEVKCGDAIQTIFESPNGLEEVSVKNNKILISHLNFNGIDPIIMRTENICGFEIKYREITSHETHKKKKSDSIRKPIIGLTKFKNGRWTSETDSLSGIEIKNGKWILFYKGMETDSSDVYNFKVRKEHFKDLNTVQKPIEYLTLINQSDTLNYSIIEYSDDLLSLVYIQRGNKLNYKPEK